MEGGTTTSLWMWGVEPLIWNMSQPPLWHKLILTDCTAVYGTVYSDWGAASPNLISPPWKGSEVQACLFKATGSTGPAWSVAAAAAVRARLNRFDSAYSSTLCSKSRPPPTWHAFHDSAVTHARPPFVHILWAPTRSANVNRYAKPNQTRERRGTGGAWGGSGGKNSHFFYDSWGLQWDSTELRWRSFFSSCYWSLSAQSHGETLKAYHLRLSSFYWWQVLLTLTPFKNTLKKNKNVVLIEVQLILLGPVPV